MMNKKNMKGTLLLGVFFAFLGVITATSCSSDDNSEPTSDVPENLKGTTGIEKFATKVDYSSADNWLSLPDSLFIALTLDVHDKFFYFATPFVTH